MLSIHHRVILLGLILSFALCSIELYGQDRGHRIRPGVGGEPRVALVIGNSAYSESPLKNPVNDARDMAATLKKLGFKMIFGEDMTREGMIRAIDEFGQRLRYGGVGLFYFAGHGMQVKGENYLIPVQARIQKELDVEVVAVQLARVLNEIEAAGNRLNIVILDACRNNPFPRSFRSGSQGLGEVKAPTGTIIAYATSPNSTASDGNGRNGLYTEGLLSKILLPGLKVEEVFKQVRTHVRQKSGGSQTPWEHSSLEGDFYFMPNGVATASPATAITPSPTVLEIQTNPIDPSVPDRTGQWVVVAEESIQIDTRSSWVDTGINVKTGQDLWIKAGGQQVNLGSLGYVGVNGTSKPDSRKPLGACPTGALIARLSNELICVKSEGRFTARSSGALALGVNESNLSDNRGGWVAKVTVQEFRRQ